MLLLNIFQLLKTMMITHLLLMKNIMIVFKVCSKMLKRRAQPLMRSILLMKIFLSKKPLKFQKLDLLKVQKF